MKSGLCPTTNNGNNGITLNKSSLSLEIGQQEALISTVLPDNATDKSVNWSSSDTSIATIDSNGKVTAVSAGKATITCKANDGSNVEATCAVSVRAGCIEINATNFPDENFRNYLLYQSYGKDGVLTDEETKGVTKLTVAFHMDISSLKGVEYFTALTELYCRYNQLTSLDVSKNTALTSLMFYENRIKGTAMDYLISSLPQNTTNDNHYFDVINPTSENEGNVCTKAQVAAVKAKGWLPRYWDNDANEYKDYEGSDEVEVEEDTDISKLNNVIYINKVEASAGSQVDLSIRMKNTAPIRGFQFNLYLPKGVTAVKNNKGRILASLTDDRREADDEHTLTTAEQTDGSILFLCGSQYDETFTGNDGEIATLTVSIAEDLADGDYPLILKNIKLTETDISKFYETAEVKTTLTVTSFTPGDINNDGKVDVSDYIGVANRILGNTPAGFNERAADVDGNGVIDVSDYIGVANIILTGSIYGNSSQSRITRNGYIEQ